MYHYDPTTALEELNEEAVLPNPVRVRDMMLRAHLDAAPLPSPRKTASILDPSAGSSGAHKPWIPCDVAGLISIF